MKKMLEQYEFIHKMNYTMYIIFKHNLNTRENVPLENMLGGSYDNGDNELTIFNVSESKAKRLQTLQNDMLGGL